MKGLQKISLPYKKLMYYSVSLVLMLVILVGLAIAGEKQISEQKTQIASLQKTLKDNTNKINSLTKVNASQSAQITSLLTKPTPTPEVITRTQYQTQYVPENNDNSQNNPPPIEDTYKPPVTYNQIGNTGQAYGSNGSYCIPIGNSMSCSGGR